MIPANPTENLPPASTETLELIDRESDALCNKITNAYFKKHPECRGAKETRIRRICSEDTAHHLAFLRNAMRTGIPKLFSSYTLWLKNVLISRNLDTSHTKDALELMKQQLSELLPASERNNMNTIMELAIEAFEQSSGSLVSYTPPNLIEYEATGAYTQALISSDRSSAGNIIKQAMDNGTSFADASVGIMQPALYEVGRLWQVNQLTVAQEHLATAMTQYILAKAYAQAEFHAPIDRRALFACVEGNYHSLGLRMVSDAFEVEGWSVDYLGDSTPADSLIQMLDQNPVDLLGLSISLNDQVLSLSTAIEQIRSALGSRCPAIAVGGLPLNTMPGLALRIKADIWFPNAKAASKEAK